MASEKPTKRPCSTLTTTNIALIVYCLCFVISFGIFYSITHEWIGDLVYDIRLKTDSRIIPKNTIAAIRDNLGFKNKITCSSKFNTKPIFEKHGEYSVIYNSFAAQTCPPCDGDITIAVHGDPSYLKFVPGLAYGWQGAISMAIYVPSYWNSTLFEDLAQAIAEVYSCTVGNVGSHVSYHVYFKNDPKVTGQVEENIDSDRVQYFLGVRSFFEAQELKVDCTRAVPSWEQIGKFYEAERATNPSSGPKELYPINVGRNIAIKAATTYHVMPSDVKLVPGPLHIQHKLLQFVKTSEENYVQPDSQKMAFVLPIYEVDKEKGDFPVNSKKVLLRNLKEGNAARFHIKICQDCYTMPYADEWERGLWPNGTRVDGAEREEIARIHSISRREGEFASWDPVFIAAKKDIPEFDERLSWEGKRDRKSVMFELCANNFSFAILEEGFLVHQPGIKPAGLPMPEWRKSVITNQNIIIDEQIKPELIKRYPWAAGKCAL